MSSITNTSSNPFTYSIPRPEKGAALSPNLSSLTYLCDQLLETFHNNESPYNARQFASALRGFSLEEFERRSLLAMPPGKHVLVSNALMKVSLIHWDQGETSSVHGHPAGGCMFKLLHGNLVERRFDPFTRDLMSTHGYGQGAMAYIDDTIALHDVSNRSRHAAISLHVYTPGQISAAPERSILSAYVNN